MTSWLLRSWRNRSIAHFGGTTAANSKSSFTKIRSSSAPKDTRRFEPIKGQYGRRSASLFAHAAHGPLLRGHAAALVDRRSLAEAVDGPGTACRNGVGRPASRPHRVHALHSTGTCDRHAGMGQRYYRRWKA